jgi:hypothetical protein
MMKEEFEKRIGLVITGEEYEEIETAYRGMPESVDKDRFVKIWLQEGGIQDLFNKRLFEIHRQRESLKDILKENNQVSERFHDCVAEIKDLKNQLETCKGKLAAISGIAEVVA